MINLQSGLVQGTAAARLSLEQSYFFICHPAVETNSENYPQPNVSYNTYIALYDTLYQHTRKIGTIGRHARLSLLGIALAYKLAYIVFIIKLKATSQA